MGITPRQLRRRLLEGFADQMPGGLWDEGDEIPPYSLYLRDARWKRIKASVHGVFGGRCWVCNRTPPQLDTAWGLSGRGAHRLPARTVPGMRGHRPDTSDVVLLCDADHLELDDWASQRAWWNLNELRRDHVEKLQRMRLDAT